MQMPKPKAPSATSHFRWTQRIALAVVPPVTVALLHVLGSTLRFRMVAETGAAPADQDVHGGLYVFWHRSLLMSAYRYRNLGIRILISSSFDGELIARIVQRLGFVPVRGSSSRGGAAGLIELAGALRAGRKVAITADGPRGPVYVAKPGAVAVAQRAGRAIQRESESQTPTPAPVHAFALHPSRAWTLHSWDRFLIPKPFARVRCAWVTPVMVTPGEPGNEANHHLQSALDRAVALAEGEN